MPIYAYQCSSCGHAKDVLQKMSDPQLSVCPACGAPTFTKQVTAAGFQLKGSGWYVTDFRGGNANANAAPAATPVQTATNAASGNDAPSAATATPAPSSSAAAPAAAPAASTASAASTSSETTK